MKNVRWPPSLMHDAEIEAYIYFDKNIRALPKKSDGTIDTLKPGFRNNDVDAFRHAYVSGVFTLEYGKKVATTLGWLNEFFYPSSVGDRNMDLWNNEEGRKLGLKHKDKHDLLMAVKTALATGSLITTLSDNRVFRGAEIPKPKGEHSVIVLDENDGGANKLFFDIATSKGMDRAEFVKKIKSGQYPGYIIRKIGDVEYPASKRNNSTTDNLG